MIKGFILYNEGKIPFVLDDYQMELFTDDTILTDFTKEHNFKTNYTINGKWFMNGSIGNDATFLVEHSVGCTLYLRCYILYSLSNNDNYNYIGFQSPALDDIFRYGYEYIDGARNGVNFSVETKEIYKINFTMDNTQYKLAYRIGYNNAIGLLEDYNRKGEVLIPFENDNLQQILDITTVLNRLAMFLHSFAEIPFKRITLYKDSLPMGRFYCPLILENAVSLEETFFREFDVNKYVPLILNNIALDSGNRITKSIPLGHLPNEENRYSPQRFVQLVMSFEYLFGKLEKRKSKDRTFTLKKELEYMFNKFPEILSKFSMNADETSERIKTIRHDITHGKAYYYDFKTDFECYRLMIVLDDLIRKMSLSQIGFSDDDIKNCFMF